MTLKGAIFGIKEKYENVNIDTTERVINALCILTGEASDDCGNAYNIIRISLALHYGRLNDEIFTVSETLWLMQNGSRIFGMIEQIKERIGA